MKDLKIHERCGFLLKDEFINVLNRNVLDRSVQRTCLYQRQPHASAVSQAETAKNHHCYVKADLWLGRYLFFIYSTEVLHFAIYAFASP